MRDQSPGEQSGEPMIGKCRRNFLAKQFPSRVQWRNHIEPGRNAWNWSEMVSKKRAAAALAALVVAFTGAVSSSANAGTAAASNSIQNNGVSGIGVIHTPDGIYDYATHDAILPSGKSTTQVFPWTTVRGFYVGPGYCVTVYRVGAGWENPLPHKSTPYVIGSQTSYILAAFKRTDPRCYGA